MAKAVVGSSLRDRTTKATGKAGRTANATTIIISQVAVVRTIQLEVVLARHRPIPRTSGITLASGRSKMSRCSSNSRVSRTVSHASSTTHRTNSLTKTSRARASLGSNIQEALMLALMMTGMETSNLSNSRNSSSSQLSHSSSRRRRARLKCHLSRISKGLSHLLRHLRKMLL